MKQGEKKKNSGTETRKKSALVGFRASPEEHAALKAAAEAAQLTLGSYIRAKMLKKIETRPTPRPSIDRQMLAAALALLGKVGSNLNQMARTMNEGNSVERNRILGALDEFRYLKDRIILAIGGLCDNQGQVAPRRARARALPTETREE